MGWTRIEEENEFIEYFIHERSVLDKRRRTDTPQYVRAIVGYLSKQFDTDLQNPDIGKIDGQPGRSLDSVGWVESGDLLKGVRQDHPKIPPATFYRLLTELETNKLIEKDHRRPKNKYSVGKPPLSYRVPVGHSRIDFATREEIVTDLTCAWRSIAKIGKELFAAKVLLKKCHANDPGYNSKEAIMGKARQLFPDYDKPL